MMDAHRRYVASDQTGHALPGDSAALAAPRQSAVPKPVHPEPEPSQGGTVHRDTVVTKMSRHHRTQPLANLRDGLVHSPPQLDFDFSQFRLQSLGHGLTQDREVLPVSLLGTDVREAEKVERLRFAQATLPPIEGSPRAELDQPGLVRVQLQPELGEPLTQGGQELLRLGAMLKSNNEVVRVTHDDDIAGRLRLPPLLDPQVEHIVQVDVGHQRANAAALHRTGGTLRSDPILQHAGLQPFTDEPTDARVRNPVLDELHQPFVVDGIEEPTNVRVQHPVHLPRQQTDVECVQRLVLAASRSEAIREAQEVRLVDGVQHLRCGPLDDFVLQRGHAQRSLLAVRFGYVRSTRGLGPVRSAFQPCRQVLKVGLQVLSVLLPRLSVHARCGIAFEADVSLPKRGWVVDVVHQRGVSLDFPIRPAGPSPQVNMGSPGSRAGCFRTCTGSLTARGPVASCVGDATDVAFRFSLQRRHPEGGFSRLNTRPVRTPVNASPTPSRAPAHDSGPLWAASPSTYDSFIHNTLPV